jgi:hypothetical protein
VARGAGEYEAGGSAGGRRRPPATEKLSFGVVDALRLQKKLSFGVVDALRLQKKLSFGVVDALRLQEKLSFGVVDALRLQKKLSFGVVDVLRRNEPPLVGWARPRYPPAMLARKARVTGGRLVFDVPTTLPEGTEVDVITPEEEPIELDEQERARLEESLAASWANARAGRTRPLNELLAELRTRG